VDNRIIGVANAIRSDRYPNAAAVFAAGSIVRGEGTASSDLDLVVVFASLPCAYRESFRFDGYPVEAFVHDPETLEYFFLEVDRPSGVPALPQMVVEGVEVPTANDLSRDLKRLASSVIAAGPPALDAQTEQRMRYFVSDLVDDLRAPRSKDELMGTGAALYEQLADYYLRRQGLWSAKGKAIPRVLQRIDLELSRKYSQSFNALFTLGDATGVVRMAEELLRAAGGPLFDGYRADAPSTWRRASGTRLSNQPPQPTSGSKER
jgi:predicted nucleotidyltransferase